MSHSSLRSGLIPKLFIDSDCRLHLEELSSSEIYTTELRNDTEVQTGLCLLRSRQDLLCLFKLSLAMWGRNGCELRRRKVRETYISTCKIISRSVHTANSYLSWLPGTLVSPRAAAHFSLLHLKCFPYIWKGSLSPQFRKDPEISWDEKVSIPQPGSWSMEIQALVDEFLCCAIPPAPAGCDLGSWQDTAAGTAPAPWAWEQARHTLSASAPANWE